MFRASSCPSSGATTTAVAASGFYRWSVVIAVLLVMVGLVVEVVGHEHLAVNI
jgi:cytochrome c oxidase subunit IV